MTLSKDHTRKRLAERVSESARFIQRNICDNVDFSLFLGSGFVIDTSIFVEKSAVPYCEIPHFIQPAVTTHEGVVRFGTVGNKGVLIFQGRVHAYEAYTLQEVAYNAWVAATISSHGLILTSLVGGINSRYEVGDFVVVKDHINLSGLSPLIKADETLGTRFVDMLDAYNEEWSRKILDAAAGSGIRINEGILAFLPGPSFETRAELRFLESIGADIVGWSVVPEVLAARQVGKELVAISCVSDLSKPATLSEVDLDSIWRVGAEKSAALFQLIEGLMSRL